MTESRFNEGRTPSPRPTSLTRTELLPDVLHLLEWAHDHGKSELETLCIRWLQDCHSVDVSLALEHHSPTLQAAIQVTRGFGPRSSDERRQVLEMGLAEAERLGELGIATRHLREAFSEALL